MSQSRSIVHIGLPKVGSTFLQRRLFPFLEAFEFHTSLGGSMADPFRWVYRLNGPYLPIELPRTRRRRSLEQIFEEEYARLEPVRSTDGRRLLLSSEGLVGVSHDPLLNADLSARMLAKQLPGAGVVLCLRRQDDWSASMYRQLVFSEDRFRRYLRFDEMYDASSPGALVPVKELAWDRIVEIYQAGFGKDNVCVLAYEEMVGAPDRYVDRLLSFLGVTNVNRFDLSQRENARPAESRYTRGSWSRRLRQVAGGVRDGRDRFGYEMRGVLRDLTTGNTNEGAVFQAPPPGQRAAILSALQDSNRRLTALTGIDFGGYGYYEQ